MAGSNPLMKPKNAGIDLLPATLAFAYMFDYALTAVLMLWNDRWVDIAHYIFVPFIGVYGYLGLRAILMLAIVWFYRLSSNREVRTACKVLTVYYVLVCLWNIGNIIYTL